MNDVQNQINQLNAALNPEQKVGAETTEGYVMLLAGAGSGKTKTLINRVGTLLLKGVPPTNILLITFTNKAANEIKERLEAMIGEQAQHVTAGTFHSVAFREILKRYPESEYLRGLDIDMEQTSILDDDDSKSLLKQAIDELDEDDAAACEENDWGVGEFTSILTMERAHGRDVHEFTEGITPGSSSELRDRILSRVWASYNTKCRAAQGIDFDDILLISSKMIRKEPRIKEELGERFRYTMVDEYQDTNVVQMNLTDDIAERFGNLFVVGDNRQSIYRWRGSLISIIMSFEKRHSNVKKIILDKNYRSLGSIIDAANACDQAMAERLTDNILTAMSKPPAGHENNPMMDKVSLVSFDNAKCEAKHIGVAISRDLVQGVPGEEVAVLYRSRANKQLLEKELWEKNIPYHVVGDTAFFKRAEVKDTVAMIRFIFNPWDSMAGLRLLKATSLGVSDQRAKRAMSEEGLSVQGFLEKEAERRLKPTKANPEGILSAAARKISPFVKIGERLRESLKLQDSPEFISECLSQIWDLCLLPTVKKLASKDKDQVEALEERVGNARIVLDRVKEQLEEGMTIQEVIEDLTMMIEHDPETDRNMSSKVKLMTIHASKGLEFNNVYIIGHDDQNTPGETDDYDEIEESRRVTYVAITRARHKLTISHARERVQYGNLIETMPSRFVLEVSNRTKNPIRHIEGMPKRSVEKKFQVGETLEMN